jgi:hypothetical protein
MRAAYILMATALALPGVALSEPKVGDALSCTSKDPAKRLVAVVGLIEPFGQDRVAHVTLRNEAPGAVPGVIAHLPVQLAALEAGCPKPVDGPRQVDANFEGGLAQWREAVRTQRAGIFTISADQIYDFIRQNIARAGASAP